MPRSERMSRVDTAWLRMDNDVNLMMIVGVWLVDGALDAAAFTERLAARLLRYERFRQKVVQDATGATWVDDEAFDIRHHVLREKLEPAPGETPRHALQALCGRLATLPLDPARPLWSFHLVEGYEGGSAVIARIHHCIADGIALIRVTMSVTDGGVPPRRRFGRSALPVRGEEDWLAGLIEPIAELTAKAIDAAGGGVAKSVDLLAHPRQGVVETIALAHTGARVLGDLAAIALMPDDSPTRLKGRGEGRKVVAWNEPIPLDAVKAVGKALGCSVNDVLLACAAGAIGAWLAEQGDETAGREIRAMVPVNLRPPGEVQQLGNRFGLAPLVLPLGIGNPVERVFDVRRRMAGLKESFQPLLAFAVLAVAGLMVKPVQDAILNLFAKKTTAVMTNVPGPAEPLRLCGHRIRQTMFWVPASGEIGVGVSILSYAGGVQFGLWTDHKLCPEPQQIIDRFAPEFEKLLYLALMLPWGAPEAA